MLVRLALLIGLITAHGATAQELVLRGATLIDGNGGAPRANVNVVIREGKIAEITTASVETAAETIDLDGRYLLPGLIDAHAHILSPAAAERALASGVTTARVLGDQYLRAVGTRDLIREGYVVGPELLCSGGHVRPGLGLSFVLTFPQFGRYLDEKLSGPTNVATVVRAVLDRGADVIKVGATERAGLVSTDPRRQELSLEEIRAAVNEAAQDGKFVAAHAHGAAGAEAAVEAGVRSIEHGTYINDRTLALMKEKGTFLVPTLAIMSPLGDPHTDSAHDVALQLRTRHMQPALRAVVRKAREMGIGIAASTDGTYGDGDETARVRVQHDMEHMLEIGFSPMEAIVAATRNGARVLAIENRTGTIAEGLEADLIVLDRNPLEDFRVLFEPLVIVNNGKVFSNRIYGASDR
jgi:imidazolonepropionase-like amidohydrolase